ncbi:MAG: 5-methyltetrahydrofolate--homocysteine methyltransferase [Chloroflexota bacterium]|nr:5-methyltetrahydrofolate--homocysteine methyltransferase [Chloroflexota bacterium]
MKKDAFLKVLDEKRYLISDGATGTNLMQRGLPQGTAAEDWVLSNPDGILGLHHDFLEAGSDIILTCTFGASLPRLEANGLASHFQAVNQAAVSLAKTAAENYGALVAGSLGPLGQMLKPLGTLEESDAQQFYKEQAELLSQAGVDLLVVETQFDLTEANAAVRGVREVSELPLIVSFSFDRGTRTMMGVSPSQFAKQMNGLGLTALGINCGKSLADNLNALKELADATDLPIWFKPNAGLPEVDDEGHATYDVTPDIMAAQVESWAQAGARIIGGCCGTSPAHLKAIANQVKSLRA